ncbi:MAG TPA: lipopolysaccharide assembly protein LapA domain-containing protein [Roseiflexaceae bacterium]|nr:lipopolysaccharide assembly protein LapA domain-containing protein [Roseiflexaceae bacterium]
MRYLIGAALLIVAVLLVLFGVQNPQPVSVRFLWLATEDLSLSLVIVLAAICGAVLVGLLHVWGSIRRGVRGLRDRRERTALETRAQGLEQKIATLEQENASLKERASAVEQPTVADTPVAPAEPSTPANPS